MGKRSREKRERREKEGVRKKSFNSPPEENISLICLTVIRWLTYLTLFTSLIVSVKFFFPFVAPKSLYFMGLTEIIFATWLILIIYSSQHRPRLNVLTLILIIFVVILILSTLFGTDISRSFWSKPERMTGTLMWFHLLAFFLVISSVFKKSKDWMKIFAISVFVAILVSLLSMFPKLGLGIMPQSSRGGATIGNSSFMGVYLLFNIFFALWLFINSKMELKIYSLIALSIIIPALFLSGARAATLSLIGGLVLLTFLYLTFSSHKRYLKILGIFCLASSILAGIVFMVLIFQPDNLARTLFEKAISTDRRIVWKSAWQGFLERPLLGWGPENFDFIFTKYYNPCLGTSECGRDIWFDRAHNIIFDTLSTTGILGLLGYLAIFLSAFYILWRKYFQKVINFWTVSIFSVILISYFVQNLTVFDMINSYLMFFLVLGMIGSFSSFPISTEKKVQSKFLWLIAILILTPFSFSFSKFIVKPLQTDYYVIAAIRQPPASEEKLLLYKKALESSPFGKYQIRDFFAQNTLSSIRSEKGKEIGLKNFREELDFVSQELEKSIKEAPLEFRSFLKLGQVYNIYGLIDSSKLIKAEEVLKKAIELSPTNQQGYWALAQTRLYQNKEKEAFLLAEKAVELEPKLERSHLILVQIARFMDDEELVKKKAAEAIKILPSLEPELKKMLED